MSFSQKPIEDSRTPDQRADAMLADPTDYELLRNNWRSMMRENGLSTMPVEERMERARRAACGMLGLKYSEATRNMSAVERIAGAMEGGLMAPTPSDKQQLHSALFVVKISAAVIVVLLAGGPKIMVFMVAACALVAILCVRYGKPPELAEFLKTHINWIGMVEKDAEQPAPAVKPVDVTKRPLPDISHGLAPKVKQATSTAQPTFMVATEFGLRPDEFERPDFDLKINK